MTTYSRLASFALLVLLVAPSSLLGRSVDYHPGPSFQPSQDSFVQFVARKKSKGSRKASYSLIHNVRYHEHSRYTRVVLDLKKAADYTTNQTKNPPQVTINLKKTILGNKSRNGFQAKGFPTSLKVRESKPYGITITLDMRSLSKYKIMALKKPYRLVLDLFPAPAKPHKVKIPTAKPKPPPVIVQPILPPANLRSGKKLLIVLDPGHGGKDPGALGRKGTREKDIVLKIAKQVKEKIQKRMGAKVLLTRDKDVFVKLEDRAEFANSKKADLFVSIHVNSHRSRKVKGLELYHFGEASDPRSLEVAARENGTPLKENGPAWQFILADKLNDKKIEDSQELAWTTQNALVKYLKTHYKVKDHGVKTAPFFVLRMTTMPSILAEIAFVSNPTEEKLLRSKTYQTRVAEGIFKGINAYVQPLRTAAR
ncbi:MAG: N-acetylmuramoyl-L-alanine amidase [Nitrospirota bacterium]|nr:MAG: N-acetylmuramoyl-L-alanine amidase [Nitrospirota bacterium]